MTASFEHEAEFIESVARAMCSADGLDPDEHGPAVPSRALTAGEAATGETLPLAVPNWRNYRRQAILVGAGSNEMWAVAARIVDREHEAQKDASPE